MWGKMIALCDLGVSALVCAVIASLQPLPCGHWSPTLDQDVRAKVEELCTNGSEEAISELVLMGKSALTPLIGVMETGAPDSAWQAARAMRAMGSGASSSKSKLVQKLRDVKLPNSRRALAAWTLAGLGTQAQSACKPLLVALDECPPSELTLMAALALAEIGEPSATWLAKRIKHKDVLAGVWSVSILAQFPGETKKAKKALIKCVRSLSFEADEYVHYLQQTIAMRILEAVAKDYEYSLFENRIPRGGNLSPEQVASPEQLEAMLIKQFGLTQDESAGGIALPKKVDDLDENGTITTGELLRALSTHLAVSVSELRSDLSDGSARSYEQWKSQCAGPMGLVRVLHAYTRPAFLERSKCLELAFTEFEGFESPDAK